jgi:hypothetical protein
MWYTHICYSRLSWYHILHPWGALVWHTHSVWHNGNISHLVRPCIVKYMWYYVFWQGRMPRGRVVHKSAPFELTCSIVRPWCSNNVTAFDFAIDIYIWLFGLMLWEDLFTCFLPFFINPFNVQWIWQVWTYLYSLWYSSERDKCYLHTISVRLTSQ